MESLFLPPEAERATWVEDEPIAAMSKEATDSRRFVPPPIPTWTSGKQRCGEVSLPSIQVLSQAGPAKAEAGEARELVVALPLSIASQRDLCH